MSSSAGKVDVVILAGGPGMQLPDGTVEHRAMIPVAGKPMLQWEVDALRNSGAVSSIYAVGDCDISGIDELITPTDTFPGNMLAGVNRAQENGAEHVLIATCDIPLITEEGIRDFIERAQDTDAVFCYPIIPKQDCLAKYPDMKRTYLRLQEGTFSGGNMVLVSVDFVVRNQDTISQAYEARKKVLKLAGMIGWGTLLRVIVAQIALPSAVNLSMLENTVSRLLNGRVAAVITSYAEIGEDVDKPEDLAVVERLLSLEKAGQV